MATVREECNPYDGVLEAGGKFRKRSLRRTTKPTPYDRPPTSIRSTSGNSDRNGWLSKLVDPARRLITSSAHRLFASVFMKRLPPPPPQTLQLLDSESNEEPSENRPVVTSTVPPVEQGAIIGCRNPINHTEESGVAKLEEILKQKTFTRSEIDLLTNLLRSRSADISGGNEEKTPELTSMVSHDKKEEFPKTPVRENVTENHLISSPVVSSTISGTSSDAFGGPSLPQSAWEQSSNSGSRQGALKRRNSVLDNDIGSVGPIRRIHQKSNLSSKTSSLPASAGPLSAHIAGIGSAGLDSLAENGDNSTPGTSFTSVPSKSSQVASKILQQLDMLVSPGDKTPTKLSTSMLRGQALKSLETVDSSKILESMHDNEKLNGSRTALTGFQDSIFHKHDKVKENCSTVLDDLPDKSLPAVNGADSNSLMKDNNVPSVTAVDSSGTKSVIQQSQRKSRAFQMSAHEDYLDDDDYPRGSIHADGRGRLDNCVMGSKSAPPEAIEMPSSLSNFEPISSAAFNLKPDLEISDGSASIETNACVTFLVVEMGTSSLQSAFVASPSTPTANNDAVSSHSNAPYMLGIGEEVLAAKQSNVAATTFCFASTNAGEVSSVTGSSGVKLATSSDQKLENSRSFATTAPGTTNYLSDNSHKENNLNENFCRSPDDTITFSVSTSTSAGNIFKFGASKDSSTLNNGSIASSPFSFSSPMPSLVQSNGQNSSSAAATGSDASAAATTSASATANATISRIGNPSVEASIHSFAPVFKFSSSGDPSTSISTLSAISGEETKSKTQDTSLGNVGIFSFGGTSAFTSSGSSIFGGTLKSKVLQAALLVQQLKLQALEIAVSVVYLPPLQTLQVVFLAAHFLESQAMVSSVVCLQLPAQKWYLWWYICN